MYYICQYKWYDLCYFQATKENFPFNHEVMVHVIGISKVEGNQMAQWVLKYNVNVVPRRTLTPKDVAEIKSHVKINKIDTFYALVQSI